MEGYASMTRQRIWSVLRSPAIIMPEDPTGQGGGVNVELFENAGAAARCFAGVPAADWM
jgi:hypothetical protein